MAVIICLPCHACHTEEAARAFRRSSLEPADGSAAIHRGGAGELDVDHHRGRQNVVPRPPNRPLQIIEFVDIFWGYRWRTGIPAQEPFSNASGAVRARATPIRAVDLPV
jgi:hypothetical protein